MSWLNQYIEAAEEAETPTSYIYWSAISTISAIISPNVDINRGGVYRLSPNTFIMLIGESGLGKGWPINTSKKLVTMVDSTRLISGMNTIQAIIRELGMSKSDPKTGEVKHKDSRAYIVSGEFATLLREDKAALPVLTEIYDTHYAGKWKNSTKGSGIDYLEKPCITLFGGSTPEHFANVVPESDVKGGFVGRILTVYAEERSKVNPLDDTEVDDKTPYEELAKHLREISKVKGSFKFEQKFARPYWKEWYHDVRTRKVHDPTGAVNRLPDNVLKVAMCLSMARGCSLVLERDDLEEAVIKCMNLTIDSRRLTEGRGDSELGKATKLVFYELYKAENHRISKSKLLQLHYGQFDAFALDRIIVTLETSDSIVMVKDGNQHYLQMLPETVEKVKKWMEKL